MPTPLASLRRGLFTSAVCVAVGTLGASGMTSAAAATPPTLRAADTATTAMNTTAYTAYTATAPAEGPREPRPSSASRAQRAAKRPVTTSQKRASRAAQQPRVAMSRAARVRAVQAAKARAMAATPAARAMRKAARQAAATPTGVSAATARSAVAAFPLMRQFAWATPVAGIYKSSPFGQRWGRLHAGLDFAGAVGTPVRAPSSGIVTFAGEQGAFGNKIEVTHWDGTVLDFGHLSKFSVKVGQHVDPGQLIGQLGNTGRSTGPHVHIQVRPGGGDPIDPAPWLLARGIMPVDTVR